MSLRGVKGCLREDVLARAQQRKNISSELLTLQRTALGVQPHSPSPTGPNPLSGQ